jgi:hypothetical protein
LLPSNRNEIFKEGPIMIATSSKQMTATTHDAKPMTLSQVAAPEPTVTYEKATIIEATVVVYPPAPVDSKPIFEAPLIAIPGSGSPSIPAHSVLIWTLVDGSNAFKTLEFSNPGFKGGQLPPGVTLWGPGVLDVAPKQRLVLVENQVSEPRQFDYTIEINYSYSSSPQELLQTSHDPTIVVTTEPIDG